MGGRTQQVGAEVVADEGLEVGAGEALVAEDDLPGCGRQQLWDGIYFGTGYIREVSVTKILVDVDDHTLAKAAARLGTATKKDTIGRALELATQDRMSGDEARQWDAWADSVGERIAEVDWDQAWR